MLSSFFGYPESEDEMKKNLRQHQRYYNSMKEELKIDHVCKDIEEVAIPIESNMYCLCYYKFIDVTTFDFVGDSIFEASNNRLKRGDITVSTNMNIDTSALTQVQIIKTQA